MKHVYVLFIVQGDGDSCTIHDLHSLYETLDRAREVASTVVKGLDPIAIDQSFINEAGGCLIRYSNRENEPRSLNYGFSGGILIERCELS